jgi:hypothetical protein
MRCALTNFWGAFLAVVTEKYSQTRFFLLNKNARLITIPKALTLHQQSATN